MTVFVTVAEAESFAGAARRLEISPPTVTRAIATLEEHLGVKLLHRSTRCVRTTEAGTRYLDEVRRVIAAATAADEAAVGVHGEAQGELTVTAPQMFGRVHVMPAIVEFLNQHPRVSVSTLLFDRIVNLIEEDVDVGVRIGDLPDSGYKALRVGRTRCHLCASPKYLAQWGAPTRPGDLKQHSVIATSALPPAVEWRFGSDNQAITVRILPRLTVTSSEAALTAALSGFGIARLLSYQVSPHVLKGDLVLLLEDYAPNPFPIHILHRDGIRTSAKVRSFVDLLADRLRADPSLR